jgi:hypothetical protein
MLIAAMGWLQIQSYFLVTDGTQGQLDHDDSGVWLVKVKPGDWWSEGKMLNLYAKDPKFRIC